MRVLVLYNQPVLPPGHPDAESEREIIETVDVVCGHLAAGGYHFSRLAVERDLEVLLRGLRRQRPDVVFNLFEGLADHYETESVVAGLLDWLGIPYTGCPFETLAMARNKVLTKCLLQSAGLPTPGFFVVEEPPIPPCELEWPVIVKPANQDASVGLDQGSVVTEQERLEARVAHLLETYGPPVLVEEFIRGREFNVAIIECPDLRVLPPSEILFLEKDPDFWPIVTYAAKWKPGSREYEATPPSHPALVSPRLAEKLGDLARRAFHLLGCRDYARVDFRVRNGKPYILEVNPNPCFHPNGGLIGGLESASVTPAQFTAELVEAAAARKMAPLQLSTGAAAQRVS
jgi:D-alanine-D-alanine ligase